MTCSNDYTVIGSLLALMEMFVIYDSNIMIGDIAEDISVIYSLGRVNKATASTSGKNLF
jgi:hypothetical protein